MKGSPSLDGIIVIDKPAGWTSHDVVARMRGLLKTRRIGHTGTLDPFATGVLVTCIDRATRIVRFLSGDDKEYLATLRLGYATDTGDLTGRTITPVADATHITTAALNGALSHFRGRMEQTPPMYSAKKIGGTKLYEMARRGLEIERRPVDVEIKELELIKILETSDSGEIPHKDCLIRVVCSAGTYVRTLAEDIGNRLGIGAHLIELRRARAGNFGLNRAVALEQLIKLAEADEVERVMLPMVDALNFEIIKLDEEERNAIRHGRSFRRRGDWSNGTQAMLCDQRRQLIAIAVYNGEKGLWSPQIVLVTSE